MPRTMAAPELERALVAAWQELGGPPTWAREEGAPLPTIGARYVPGESPLVYGTVDRSAWTGPGTAPRGFFPPGGLVELRAGGLLCAALLAVERLRLPAEAEPEAFLGQLALAPWYKFTLAEPPTAGTPATVGEEQLAAASLPHVTRELEILRPGVVLLPQAPWEDRGTREAMLRAAPEARFVPLPAFARLALVPLAERHGERAARLAEEHADQPLGRWVAQLTEVEPRTAWAYLAEVEQVLEAGGAR